MKTTAIVQLLATAGAACISLTRHELPPPQSFLTLNSNANQKAPNTLRDMIPNGFN